MRRAKPMLTRHYKSTSVALKACNCQIKSELVQFIPSLEYDLLLMLEAQFLIVFIILTSKLFSKSAASLNLFVN